MDFLRINGCYKGWYREQVGRVLYNTLNRSGFFYLFIVCFMWRAAKSLLGFIAVTDVLAITTVVSLNSK